MQGTCPSNECALFTLEQRVHPGPGQVRAGVQGGGGGLQRLVHQDPDGQEASQDPRGR